MPKFAIYGMLVLSAVLFKPSCCSLEGLMKGYGNIQEDSIGTDVKVLYGEVPNWINGVFVHHACGAFGDLDSKSPGVNFVNHVFDCLSIGQSFKFENGKATFYNRFYDTVQTEIYKSYNMNMSESKVFWRTGYADFDVEAMKKHEEDMKKATKKKPVNVPHVTWWRVKDKAMAMTEETIFGIQIDVNNMEVIQEFPFKDENFGYDGDHILLNNPAHEHTDHNGVTWSNIMVFLPNWWTVSAKQWRLVYKVIDDTRIKVAEIPMPDISALNCVGGDAYSDPEARMGYIHSFAATENYIILPETSYLFEPCAMIKYAKDPYSPYYKSAFVFEKDVPSILRVIRKSDGEIMAAIKTDAFFVSHQMNSYEDNGRLYLDMLVFDDDSLYDTYTWVDATMGEEGFSSRPHRFIINMADWTLEARQDFLPTPQPIEMSHVREDLWGFKYTYAYWCHGIYYNRPQVIQKINVDTKEMWNFTFHEDQYPQEPWFLPRPGSTEEDDGVLLVQGFDGRAGKGFLVILDAQTMIPITFLEASDMILFGFHVRFFPLDMQQVAEEDTQ